MIARSSKWKDGAFVTRLACAVAFLVFTFSYLYFYQADVLAFTQHVLSEGATHYNRTIGAVLITVVLWAVQLVLQAFVRLKGWCHALTYLPSLLLLAILSDVGPDLTPGNFLLPWALLFPLLMVVYAAAVWLARQYESVVELPSSAGLLTRNGWVNLLAMCVMFLCVCGIGNSDPTFHARLRMEQDIARGDYDAALLAGLHCPPDSNLTMLRVRALTEKGALGERLFEYPLEGGSRAMVPNGTSVRLLLMPDSIRMRTGGHRKDDLRLCAYLLDCDLEAFARLLPSCYPDSLSMPKHYREAMTLYDSRRGKLDGHAVMEADFQDFKTMAHEGASAIAGPYGKTYWFYYYVNHKTASSR